MASKSLRNLVNMFSHKNINQDIIWRRATRTLTFYTFSDPAYWLAGSWVVAEVSVITDHQRNYNFPSCWAEKYWWDTERHRQRGGNNVIKSKQRGKNPKKDIEWLLDWLHTIHMYQNFWGDRKTKSFNDFTMMANSSNIRFENNTKLW